MNTHHFVSACCDGERCSMCRAPATHKVGEEILPDDPMPVRHNLTAYLCCQHFRAIFGPFGGCEVGAPGVVQLSQPQHAEVLLAIDAATSDIEANIRGMRPDPGLEQWAQKQLTVLRQRLQALNEAKETMLRAIGQ